MRPLDLSRILTRYKKGWIALSADNKKLIAVGSNLKLVLEKASKKGVSNPSVLKSVPTKTFYVG